MLKLVLKEVQVIEHAGERFERIRWPGRVMWRYASYDDDEPPSLAPHEQKLLEKKYQREYE